MRALLRRVGIELFGICGAAACRLLLRTLRYDIVETEPHTDPLGSDKPVGVVAVIWHEYLFMGATAYGPTGLSTMISQSKDGDLATRIVERLGLRVIRGSSSRGAATALRKAISKENGQACDVAITADGPRGPRRIAKDGVAFIAAKTGQPMVAFGMAFQRCWRFKSWDRFAVPKPFSRATIMVGPRIHVPADADRAMLEECRQKIEQSLNHQTELAEAKVGAVRDFVKTPTPSPSPLEGGGEPEDGTPLPQRLAA